ncbi:MAG: GNAT family N-acetyltransferase [Anaerolineae bacterium]|nr:GNAT family N-acetyltransferase [Anaerolineae bacterium]
MGECYGFRSLPETEPSPENPIKPGPGMTGDNTSWTDDTTPSGIGDDLGALDDEDTASQPLTDDPGVSSTDSGVANDAGFPQDETFTDKEGRAITTRTWENGDQYMIRAYDQEVQSPPDSPNVGQAGYANLTLERDADDMVDRARLNDIQTSPEYRDSGIGGKMLGTAEQIAQQHDAREIYGNLSYEGDDEGAVRGFYQNHGYDFRATAQGEEVFKGLENTVTENPTLQDVGATDSDMDMSDLGDMDVTGDGGGGDSA